MQPIGTPPLAWLNTQLLAKTIQHFLRVWQLRKALSGLPHRSAPIAVTCINTRWDGGKPTMRGKATKTLPACESNLHAFAVAHESDGREAVGKKSTLLDG